MIAVVLIGAAVALAVLATGAAKLLGTAGMRERAAHVDVPFGAYRVIGMLEVLAAAGVILGLWVPLLGALAAGGLVLLMIGAVGAHIRADDGIRVMIPAIVVGLAASASLVLAVARL